MTLTVILLFPKTEGNMENAKRIRLLYFKQVLLLISGKGIVFPDFLTMLSPRSGLEREYIKEIARA